MIRGLFLGVGFLGACSKGFCCSVWLCHGTAFVFVCGVRSR